MTPEQEQAIADYEDALQAMQDAFRLHSTAAQRCRAVGLEYFIDSSGDRRWDETGGEIWRPRQAA